MEQKMEEVMKPRVDYSLYLCTDRELMTSDTIEEGVELAIKGGVTIVQLREKNCLGKEFLRIARSVKEVTDAYEIPLIINDRIDIAVAVDADGVHLGQKDIPAGVAREMLGKHKIIGVSAYNAELALLAQKDGADYIGVGDVFGTSTKADTHHVSYEELLKIRKTVKIPIVAIGGVKPEHMPRLTGTGVDGVAVVSAVLGAKNITEAAEEMIRQMEKLRLP